MSSGLLNHFEDLPDPRIDRTMKYPLIEIIFLIISGAICGCEGWKQIREDESRIRKDAAPENFAIMRHIALNLMPRFKPVSKEKE